MKPEVFHNFPDIPLVVIAMLIFLSIFVVMSVVAIRQPKSEIEYMERLPFTPKDVQDDKS